MLMRQSTSIIMLLLSITWLIATATIAQARQAPAGAARLAYMQSGTSVYWITLYDGEFLNPRFVTTLPTNNRINNLLTWSSDGRWLAFSSEIFGRYQLYRVRLFGDDLAAFRSGDGFAAALSWQGDTIHFLEVEPGGQRLSQVNSMGGPITQVSVENLSNPLWESGGRAYTIQSDGAARVEIVQDDGMQVEIEDFTLADWSQDAIALIERDSGFLHYATIGAEPQLIFEEAVSDAALSNDGEKLAFTVSDAIGFLSLYVWDGESIRLLGNGLGGSAKIAWTPDDQEVTIAFLQQTIRLWNIHANSGRITRLADDLPNVRSFAWSPIIDLASQPFISIALAAVLALLGICIECVVRR